MPRLPFQALPNPPPPPENSFQVKSFPRRPARNATHNVADGATGYSLAELGQARE